MAGILSFESEHGVVSVEVEDSIAKLATGTVLDGDLIAKGILDEGVEFVGNAAVNFKEAMATLRVYAANLQDILADLEQKPTSVSVELGLKLTGSAGFVIAKGGGEAAMKISMTWES